MVPARGYSAAAIKDALLVVDVIQDFRHKDGDALLESFRARQPALLHVLQHARWSGIPVIYANDNDEPNQ